MRIYLQNLDNLVKKWEQGVRKPIGAARAYLVVIARNHKAVELALTG